MNIKSNKESKKKSFNFKLDLNNKPYLKISIWITIYGTLISIIGLSWGAGITLVILAGIGFTIWLNNLLGYYNDLEWRKYFMMVGLLILTSSGGTIIPMMHDYKTAERIDELLPTEKSTKLYYNDDNKLFILFVDGMKQPLAIDRSGSSDSYNKLKADYLDKKIKVERKRIKKWYEDEVSEGYYLDGYKFD